MSELLCPLPDCGHRQEVSEVDPDCTLSEMFEHFARRHAVYDVDARYALLANVREVTS